MKRPARSFSSTPQSRALGGELKRLRKEAGLTGPNFAHRTGWDDSKVSKVESGSWNASERDLVQYLTTCGVAREAMDQFIEIYRRAFDSYWLQPQFGELKLQLRTLIAHEQIATKLHMFEPTVIHGLLQTPDYTRALLRAGSLPVEKIDPVDARFYIQESALRMLVGSNQIMHDQLFRLLFWFDRPKCKIRIIRTGTLHPALFGSFSVMEFESYKPIVYTESRVGRLFVQDPDAVADCQADIKKLEQVTSVEDSKALLTQLVSEYDRPREDPHGVAQEHP